MQQLVELAGIESLGRAVVEHVDDVDDDHVIERRVALEIGPAVLGEQFAAWVVEGALVPLEQVFATQFHQLPVEIDHHRPPHAGMGQHLAQGGAFAAADDQYVARLVVGEHGRLHQQLVVQRLVALGALDRAVEHQHAVVVVGVGDQHVLPARAALVEHPARR